MEIIYEPKGKAGEYAKRHNNGNIYKSIELNTERFKMSEQLKSIFENTAEKLFNETK